MGTIPPPPNVKRITAGAVAASLAFNELHTLTDGRRRPQADCTVGAEYKEAVVFTASDSTVTALCGRFKDESHI